jgi:hypothetical protein
VPITESAIRAGVPDAMTDAELRAWKERQIDVGVRANPIPPEYVDGLKRYVLDYVEPGGFLRAVLENNLMGAFAKADSANLEALNNWRLVVYNYLPSDCWGDSGTVNRWCARRVY